MSAAEIFAHLDVSWWKVPLVAAHLRRRMGREIERILAFPGVDGVLAHLAGQDLRLALASSNSLANVRGVLGTASLARFERIECGIPVAGKQARLRRILRRTGTAAGSAIYVGDEVRDIAAARAAGMAAGAVTWGYNDAEVLRAAGPDRMFSGVEELRGLRGTLRQTVLHNPWDFSVRD
jgi:phosphoglycolate phosphatase